MRNLIAAFGVAATVATTLAVPTFADAQSSRYYSSRDHRYHYTKSRNCAAQRRSDGNKGTLAGAGVGALSGALIGGDALGAVVGAGVGAVAGHQIAKSRSRC
jgi:outer membrane lipoprotein SlyB